MFIRPPAEFQQSFASRVHENRDFSTTAKKPVYTRGPLGRQFVPVKLIFKDALNLGVDNGRHGLDSANQKFPKKRKLKEKDSIEWTVVLE